tara:strand:- start:1119 stop:1649 length:531 start_codon:yes stop_codon:yes gene_type:complete
MACDLTAGRLLDCKDSVGGIRSILLLPLTDYTPTYTGTVLTSVATATAFRYDLPKSTGSFSEAITISTENGTCFYEDTLTIKLHRLDNAMRDELKLIAQTRMVCFVLDNNNNQWAMGEVLGAELTAGTSATGTALGDSYGYDLTIMSQEREPMRNAGTFTTNPWDNVTGLALNPAY